MITPIDPNVDKYPDSKAIILYDNVLTTASSESLPQSTMVKLLTQNTYERVSSTSTSYFFFGLGMTSATCFGVGAAADAGINMSVQFLDSGDNVLAQYFLDISNGADLISFDAMPTLASIELSFSNGSNPVDIFYVSMGNCLTMTQPIYGGHSPADLSAKTVYENNKSISGNFIGRSIERNGNITSFNWRNLDPYWYRSDFQPFVQHAKTKPFFIKWRPDYHNDEASYCWTTKDIKPTNQGGATKLMSVKMDVECFSGL